MRANTTGEEHAGALQAIMNDMRLEKNEQAFVMELFMLHLKYAQAAYIEAATICALRGVPVISIERSPLLVSTAFALCLKTCEAAMANMKPSI